MHVAALGALRRLAVAPDLHLEDLQARPILRPEEEVEHVAALRLGVANQQLGRGAAAGDGADTVEARAEAALRDQLVERRREGRLHQQQRQPQ